VIHTKAFRELERSFVDPVLAYWRDQDAEHLARSTAVIRGLIDQLPPELPPITSQVVAVSGWTTRRFGYRFSARILRRINPDYRVTLERFHRPDVPRGRRTDGFRLGFWMEADARPEAPGFRFGVAAPAGEMEILPGSSQESVAAMRTLDVPAATVEHHPPRGNVDKVQYYPQFADRPSSWFSALVHRNPQEFIEVAEVPGNEDLARAAMAVLGTYPATARWAARMGLIAWGLESTESADFELVRIRRVPANMPDPDGATVPLLLPEGRIVHAVRGTRPLPVPSSEWLTLTDARVQNGGTVLENGDLVLYELSADPVRDMVSGQFGSVIGTPAHPDAALVAVSPPAAERIDRGILLAGRNDANWFHWLIEYLPRVALIEQSVPAEVPILVTSRVPSTGIQALEALTERELVVLDPTLSYEVGTLQVLPPQVQVIDSTRVPWEEGLSLNPRSLELMRELWGVNDRKQRPTRRIFLNRSSAHRGVVNQAELAEEARALGLEIVDPVTLSWDEQRDLFASAQLVVGASGAVMANYLLLQPGARVLALTSEALADFVLPAALAAASGATFTYLVGPSRTTVADHNVRNSWLHSDFSIDAGDFRTAVLAELAAL